MSEFLSDEELKKLDPAETHAFESPIPTQPISNGEYFPGHQSQEQIKVQSLIQEYGTAFGKKHGMARREFLKSSSGLAIAFLALNEVFGKVFDVSSAGSCHAGGCFVNARIPLCGQFVCNIHTHFFFATTRDSRFLLLLREQTQDGLASILNWRSALRRWKTLKFGNYIKEMFLDGLIQRSRSEQRSVRHSHGLVSH